MGVGIAACRVVVSPLDMVGVAADDEVDWLIAWLQDGQMESVPPAALPGDVGPAQPAELDVRRPGGGVPPVRRLRCRGGYAGSTTSVRITMGPGWPHRRRL
jgi:hypothetical protein